MRVIKTPDDDVLIWLGYDEPAQTVFAWSIHHRYEVYGDVDPQMWADLCADQAPRAQLVARATKLETAAFVFPDGRSVLAEAERNGYEILRRGNGPSMALRGMAKPGSSNPDALPAIHADGDCDGGISHAWLLTEVTNDFGVRELRLFHARSYDGVVVPPDPLVTRY